MIKMQCLGPKRYVATSGASAVHVWYSPKDWGWVVEPQSEVGIAKGPREVFDTLADAREYAHDWLAEHA